MSDTQQCPNCGTPNGPGRALCQSCNTPLTAYAGQLDGQGYSGNLAGQVAAIEKRPAVVPVMAGVLGLLILVWPLNHLHIAFAGRPALNADGTNYVASAFGSIGPIFASIFFVPVAIALGIIIWGALTQRLWAWYGGLVGLVAAVFVFHGMLLTWLWVIVLLLLAGLTAAWSQRSVRDWFGVA